MTTPPLNIAVIIGSVRDGRFGPTVAEWFLSRVEGPFEVDVIDVAEVRLPLNLPSYGGQPSAETAEVLARLTPRLEKADGFVVITPEYNHSYPASLKNLIDWHFTQWQAKPVALVSYGGQSGGRHAVEHLRHVFAELHAMTLRDTISVTRYFEQFGDDGAPLDPTELNAAAKTLLTQLEWWARALAEARQKRPFAA
jgi:NAD(P)H-dependent FMN reductase